MSDPDFIVCRKCHNVYTDLTQEFCADGCHKKPPYFINGSVNLDLESRMVCLHKNPDDIMYWLCLSCLHEAETSELKQRGYICHNDSCKSENNFYPFTSKDCGTCIEKGQNRKLPIWALACEKCGGKNFILNGNRAIHDLKRTPLNSSSLWHGPDEFKIPVKSEGNKNTNQISLNLQVLNNKYETMLYADGAQIKFQDIIQKATGYIPESIYLNYLKSLALSDTVIEIYFDQEREVFSFVSMLKFTKFPLTPRFEIDGDLEIWEPGIAYEIPEGKLLQLDEDFFKIQLWVY